MIRSRCSLLGVLLTAIGLMAVFASAAQAEGEWLVLQTPGGLLIQGAALEAEKLEGSLENSTGTLLANVHGFQIAIKCTAAVLIDALLTTTGGVKTGAKIKFTGCTVLGGGANGLREELTKCEVKTDGGVVGTIETEPAHAALKLHTLTGGEKDDTLLILPDNLFQRVAVLELGAGCAIEEEVYIYGHLSVRDCGGNIKGLAHLLTHLLTEYEPLSTLSLFAPEGKEGAEGAFTDGSANIKLASDREWAPSGL